MKILIVIKSGIVTNVYSSEESSVTIIDKDDMHNELGYDGEAIENYIEREIKRDELIEVGW